MLEKTLKTHTVQYTYYCTLVFLCISVKKNCIKKLTPPCTVHKGTEYQILFHGAASAITLGGLGARSTQVLFIHTVSSS